jgi:hypothetical protein
MANVEVEYQGTKLMVPEEVSKAVAKLPVDIRNSILGTYAAAAKKNGTSTLTLKVTEKGGISVYGLGRFPVTLYATQMLRLLKVAAEIQAFIETNKSSLVWVKGEAKGVGSPS